MPDVSPEDLARLIDAAASNNFITINNVVMDRSKVSCLIQDPKGEHLVTVHFDNGEKVEFRGAEAAEVWKAFDSESGYIDN